MTTAGESERTIRAMGLDGIVLRGAHIRRLRQAAHLSVAELARRLGYSRFTVHDWEAERHACPELMYEPLLDTLEAAHLAYVERMTRLSLRTPLMRTLG